MIAREHFDVIKIGKQDPEEYPKTISRFWIHIDLMKDLYKFNQHFQNNVEDIKKQNIIGWKKSRGDGNCYFRAVISTYFLTIAFPGTPDFHLLHFKKLLQNLDLENADAESIQAQKYIEEKVNYLLELRKNPEESYKTFSSALGWTEDETFDLSLVRVSRLITLTEILKNQAHEDYFVMFIDGVDWIINDVLEMGKEGGEHSLIFLPLALGIRVIQYMFLDQPSKSIQNFPENLPDGGFDITVVRRSGHYDILYSISEMEIQQANLGEGNYHISKTRDYYNQFKKF